MIGSLLQGAPTGDGIELSSNPGSQKQDSESEARNYPDTRLGDDENETAVLNVLPSSTAEENLEVPTRPDGDIAEHGALNDRRSGRFSRTRYVSLDPARCSFKHISSTIQQSLLVLVS